MKARNIYIDEITGTHIIVWFGSRGKNGDDAIPDENYKTNGEGTKCSLIARLSVIKGELWYKASYGLPLLEKIKNKGIYDANIISIITSHPNVKNIEEWSSFVNKQTASYEFHCKILTINDELLEINQVF